MLNNNTTIPLGHYIMPIMTLNYIYECLNLLKNFNTDLEVNIRIQQQFSEN